MIQHICMGIEGAIRNAKMLKGCITVDGKTLFTVAEVRTAMRKQLAMGRKVLPTCDCLGFSFEKGRPGHSKEEADRHKAIMKIARAICNEEDACDKYCGICDDCKPYKEATEIYEKRSEK